MRPQQTADRYDPQRVYLLQKDGDKVFLGDLVDHQYAEETPGLEQACVYVAVVNAAGEIYIQHRARTKRLWPQRKTISASGHVDPGETFEQAAVREVKEELGIELNVRDLHLIGWFTGVSHGGPVHEARSDETPIPNPGELDVERSGFLRVVELERLLVDSGLFTPSGHLALGVWLSANRRSRAR
jgi:isopentenyl-diphosphate delta-isomerase